MAMRPSSSHPSAPATMSFRMRGAGVPAENPAVYAPTLARDVHAIVSCTISVFRLSAVGVAPAGNGAYATGASYRARVNGCATCTAALVACDLTTPLVDRVTVNAWGLVSAKSSQTAVIGRVLVLPVPRTDRTPTVPAAVMLESVTAVSHRSG